MTSLNLSDCSFLTDAAILNITRTCPHLSVLALSFCCALTPDAVDTIARHSTRLASLDLSYCGSAVTDGALAVIATGMDNLSRLSVRGIVIFGREI